MNEAEQRNLNRPPVQTFQSRGLDNETRRMIQKGAAIPIYTVTQADVTASRAIDATVYQNTSGKIMMAAITVYSATTGATSFAYCASNSSPAVIVGKWVNPAASTGCGVMFFVIAVNYYYKATGTNATLGAWIEWTLF